MKEQKTKFMISPEAENAAPEYRFSQQSEKQRKDYVKAPPAMQRLKYQPVKGLCDTGKQQKSQCIFFPVSCIFVSVGNEEKHNRRTKKR